MHILVTLLLLFNVFDSHESAPAEKCISMYPCSGFTTSLTGYHFCCSV